MATATTSNPADFSNRTQTLFNKKLLEALQFELVLARYGLSEGYKTIGDTIRFFRPRKANTTGVGALTEGTTPSTLTEVAVGHKDIQLGQRGALAKITDKLQAIDLINTLEVYHKTMAADCALDYDTVIRDALIDGIQGSDQTYLSAVDGGYFERFAGVTNSSTSAASFSDLSGVSKENGKISREAGLAVVTQLKTAGIPTIGGKYYGITPPQVLHDMRRDSLWLQAAVYSDPDKLYNRHAITVDGIAYSEATNPYTEGTTYGTLGTTDPGTGLIYSTIVLGKDAFGIPNLDNKRAGGSQQAPKIIVLDKADKTDPLNQLTVLGWKSFFGAAPFITNVSGERPRYVVLRSKSTFV